MILAKGELSKIYTVDINNSKNMRIVLPRIDKTCKEKIIYLVYNYKCIQRKNLVSKSHTLDSMYR